MQLRLRITALFAAVLYILLALLATWLLIHNIILAICFGLAVSVIAYAVWLITVANDHHHKFGWVYLGAGLIALLLVFILFWQKTNNSKAILLLIILSLVYIELLSILRTVYWREQRRIIEKQHKSHVFQHPYLILNPKSGNGRAIKANIPELAKKQNIEVIISKPRDDISHLAEQAVKAGADVLGVSGGDGTIGAVASIALKHDLPLVVLPGGTRCHFARDLGLDPNRMADSLACFTGVEHKIDVGDINERIFLNNASLGLYADIVDDPEYRDNKLKVSRRVLQSVVTGEKPLYNLHFKHGKQTYDKAFQVLVAVGSYNTMNLFELGQREKLDSGRLQITALLALNDAIVKKLLKSLTFNKLRELHKSDNFQQWHTKEFNFRTLDKMVTVAVDGERETYKNPVSIKIKPRALKIYVPAAGMKNRPKSPFSWFIFQKLLYLIKSHQ